MKIVQFFVDKGALSAIGQEERGCEENMVCVAVLLLDGDGDSDGAR